jgi:bifunctional NMN adenylyltransferase/nudix hydrolase
MHPAEDPRVGVLVARLQTPELPAPVRALLERLRSTHTQLIVLLGVAPLPVGRYDPLPFDARRDLLLAEFADLDVRACEDIRSDELWSAELDDLIGERSAVVYGSDSEVGDRYSGRHPFVSVGEVPAAPPELDEVEDSAAFRRGVLWATQRRYPTVFATVDVAIFDEGWERLLLARKPGEEGWRFVGGFSDPSDESFEAAARREASEETGLEISAPEYVGSFRIDDWRYVHEPDEIKTHLFAARVTGGSLAPDDDISEAEWFGLDVEVERLMPEHRELLETLRRWRGTRAT